MRFRPPEKPLLLRVLAGEEDDRLLERIEEVEAGELTLGDRVLLRICGSSGGGSSASTPREPRGHWKAISR